MEAQQNMVGEVSNPYLPESSEKKRFVRDMFDAVSSRYDFLNRLLSGFVDVYWRSQALKCIDFRMNPRLLDLATGTADMAVMAMKKGARRVIGVDISIGMLQYGRKKINRKGLSGSVHLVCGDAECLPVDREKVDAVTIAFGIRNVSDIRLALLEMHRVLVPSGVVVILEFSQPRLIGFKQLYRFYFLKVLPFVGSIFSRDKKAYYYLPHSVMKFPEREDFVRLLEESGFANIRYGDMTLGIVTVYCGIKL